MANRYANLVGSNKIKDEYTKINQGFDKVQQDMDAKPDKSIAQVNDVQMGTDDTLTIEGSTGITISTNPSQKKVIVTATGTSTPGPHGSSHTEHGADPIPNATTTEGGLMSAADKTRLDGATSAATPNTIVQRDSAGQAKFGTPSDAAHAATKGYVDATFLPAAGISGNLVFQNTGTGLQLRRGDQESRLHIADFPEAETVDIEARFFRIANTSGAKEVTIFKGDGTPTSTFKIRDGKINKLDEQNVTIAAGPNSPEGSLSAPPGSLYLRTNGELWVKKTGSGNTGWGQVSVS